MEELVRMQETLHGIRLKAAIANPDKNHPLLSLWKKAPPDEPAVTDTSAMETAAVVPDRVQPAETDGAEPSLPTVKTTSEKTSSEKQGESSVLLACWWRLCFDDYVIEGNCIVRSPVVSLTLQIRTRLQTATRRLETVPYCKQWSRLSCKW